MHYRKDYDNTDIERQGSIQGKHRSVKGSRNVEKSNRNRSQLQMSGDDSREPGGFTGDEGESLTEGEMERFQRSAAI